MSLSTESSAALLSFRYPSNKWKLVCYQCAGLFIARFNAGGGGGGVGIVVGVTQHWISVPCSYFML